MKMYDSEYVDRFHEKMEEIISRNDQQVAFQLITSELASCEDRYLPELMYTLNYLRDESALDWIEENVSRSQDISQLWGHLAASSQFNWLRGKKWLKMGRPWSLVALDALMFCTTQHARLNQSPWMREIDPKLATEIDELEVVNELKSYLVIDEVPRTRNAIRTIIDSISEKD